MNNHPVEHFTDYIACSLVFVCFCCLFVCFLPWSILMTFSLGLVRAHCHCHFTNGNTNSLSRAGAIPPCAELGRIHSWHHKPQKGKNCFPIFFSEKSAAISNDEILRIFSSWENYFSKIILWKCVVCLLGATHEAGFCEDSALGACPGKMAVRECWAGHSLHLRPQWLLQEEHVGERRVWKRAQDNARRQQIQGRGEM